MSHSVSGPEMYQAYIESGGFVPQDIAKALKLKHGYEEPKTGGSINPFPNAELTLPKVVDTLFGPNNTKERFLESTFKILREVARRNIIVASIINVRCQQVEHYDSYSEDEDRPGWKIKLKDGERKPSAGDKRTISEIKDWLGNTGRIDYDESEKREDTLGDIFHYFSREQLTIDQVATEIRWTRKGEPFDFWVLDGSTIKRLRKTGWENDANYTFIQEIQGQAYAVYEPHEIVFNYQNKRTDLSKRGYGYAYIEMAIDAITAFLFAMSYNKAQFNHSAMPRGILSFEGMNLGKEQLENLQRQWTAMFTGIKGMWKTPILQNKAQWQSIAPSNRDLEFNQYIQIVASFICAVFGIDSAELGLRLAQAQNVLTENQAAKISFSKDRGLKQLLAFIEGTINKIIHKYEPWRDYVFCFTGVEDKDQFGLQELDEKQIKSYKTVNEKRAEKDLKPIEGGDVILDAQFMQSKQAEAAPEEDMAAEGDQGQVEDEDIVSDDELDDLLDFGKSSEPKGKIKLTFSL